MNMRVSFISTFLPDRCGLATYATRVLPFIEQAAQVKRVIVPYGQSFFFRREVPIFMRAKVDLVHINFEYALYGQNIIQDFTASGICAASEALSRQQRVG